MKTVNRVLIPALVLVLLLAACGGEPAPPTSAPTAAPTEPPATAAPTELAASPTTAAVQAEPAAEQPTAEPFALTSGAFAPGETIPERHACAGEDLSPPLAWNEPPAGTASFALVMDDPDAVSVAGYVWDHWLLFNLPADLRALPEGVPAGDELADGSRHGANSWDRTDYGGPCPPGGQTHTYVFTLYALDATLDLSPGVTKDELLAALDGHVLASAELHGTYTAP